MALTIEVRINGTTDAAGRYLTWAPSPCELRVTDGDGAVAPIAVRVRTKPGSKGRLVFRTQPSATAVNELSVDLDPNGQPAILFVAGEFGVPSQADGDAALEVRQGTHGDCDDAADGADP